MAQPAVRIYTTSSCPYCIKAKNLLLRKNISFEEIDVTDPSLRAHMTEISNGRKTVPQIFIGNTHIGGCDNLHDLEKEGKLEDLSGY